MGAQRKVFNKISQSAGFPLLSEEESEVASKLGARAEDYFWDTHTNPTDEEFPEKGFLRWYVEQCE